MNAIARAALAAAVTVAALGVVAPGAAADNGGDLAGIWHRLNPRQSQAVPGPEHELLACHSAAAAWDCRYFKLPMPELNFEWNSTTGRFHGNDITATWTCPAWFPSSLCSSVAQVVEGQFVYDLAVGGTFSNVQDLVVTRTAGQERVYDYWVGSAFACPWFQSFDEALAANPFPLPYDGLNAPQLDCLIP